MSFSRVKLREIILETMILLREQEEETEDVTTTEIVGFSHPSLGKDYEYAMFPKDADSLDVMWARGSTERGANALKDPGARWAQNTDTVEIGGSTWYDMTPVESAMNRVDAAVGDIDAQIETWGASDKSWHEINGITWSGEDDIPDSIDEIEGMGENDNGDWVILPGWKYASNSSWNFALIPTGEGEDESRSQASVEVPEAFSDIDGVTVVEAVPDGAIVFSRSTRYNMSKEGDDAYIELLPDGPILKTLYSDLIDFYGSEREARETGASSDVRISRILGLLDGDIYGTVGTVIDRANEGDYGSKAQENAAYMIDYMDTGPYAGKLPLQIGLYRGGDPWDVTEEWEEYLSPRSGNVGRQLPDFKSDYMDELAKNLLLITAGASSNADALSWHIVQALLGERGRAIRDAVDAAKEKLAEIEEEAGGNDGKMRRLTRRANRGDAVWKTTLGVDLQDISKIEALFEEARQKAAMVVTAGNVLRGKLASDQELADLLDRYGIIPTETLAQYL